MQNQTQEKPTSLLDVIPGYREAIAAETEVREGAFMDAPEFICGVEVKGMTFLHLLRLRGIGSPFVCRGRVPGPDDVGVFLWCVSPVYEAALRMRLLLEPWLPRLARWLFGRVRRRFVRRLRRLPYGKVVRGVFDYVDEAFQDAPGMTESGFSPSYYAGPTVVIGRLAQEFHWSQSEILNMPLKRLFQYTRWLERQGDPKAVLFNRSDKVRGEFLKAQSRN